MRILSQTKMFATLPFIIERMKLSDEFCCILVATCCFISCLSQDAPILQQTNLLFIIFDDLRPELSVYGRDHMITPNFERLAKRSVIFDYAFTQISVCNPARDSILTGLRPDSVGTYNFQHSFYPHLSFPTQAVQSGYNSAGIGKIRHWDRDDKMLFNYEFYQNDWYPYQARERDMMNATTQPDKTRQDHQFRDYEFATRSIDVLRRMVKEPQYYMLSVGFKNPHMATHIPYAYYEMYKNRTDAWKLTKKELRYPPSTTEVPYKCCAEFKFLYMNEEGSKPPKKIIRSWDFNYVVPEEMHNELMLGYVAAISFADTQLGRILDVLDELDLWKNLTVVLTADHGMHNGEKGIWEKWSLFEESTRVPLMIAHPLTPFAGQHYKDPVELIDIYPTILELAKLPKTRNQICARTRDFKCKKLQGKSLSPIILGKDIWEANYNHYNISRSMQLFAPSYLSLTSKKRTTGLWNQLLTKDHGGSSISSSSSSGSMLRFNHNFAISQSLRCAKLSSLPFNAAYREYRKGGFTKTNKRPSRKHIWEDCDIKNASMSAVEMSLMGYSMRTPDYRYTAYYTYDRYAEATILTTLPYDEELYDHKNETLADFTHRETVNLAEKPQYLVVLMKLRDQLKNYIMHNIKFGDHK